MLIATGEPQYLLYLQYGLLCGYSITEVGHFGFEQNKPARFNRPLHSFIRIDAMDASLLTELSIGAPK